MLKKKVVVAKISRSESESFKSIEFTRQGLMNSLGVLERIKEMMWKTLTEDYKVPKGKKLTINHKTRELFYEE